MKIRSFFNRVKNIFIWDDNSETRKKYNLKYKEKNINNLKILLANEATTLMHGAKAAKDSADTAKETFVKGGLGKNIPEKAMSNKEFIQGVNIIDLIFQNKFSNWKSKYKI